MPPGLRTLVMLQILSALAGYSLWFWCKGLDSILPVADAEAGADVAPCTYYAFVLSRAEVSRLRVFGILMSGLGGICFVVADSLSLIGPALSCIPSGRRIAVWHLMAAALGIGNAQDTMDTPPWRIWAKMMASVAAVGYIVVTVEVTLAWNPIEGANDMDSVGQPVPLIIGGMGLARMAYLLLRERLQAHGGSLLASRSGSGGLELSGGIGHLLIEAVSPSGSFRLRLSLNSYRNSSSNLRSSILSDQVPPDISPRSSPYSTYQGIPPSSVG
ncbi:hypothetical protein B0T26DRAFT_339546 [Lasiosphaeria miniovina]|uniref:Uncharacterized protein n=1 Tax=Lasiosphaeria miniovina TaxID=1954250 RepID=A0AA40DTA1_9PEZI|nr:uncharacterized protein B0T26DRAFT_339546 [Lasiosphaeria miniovina]KAK0712537.1 hypothetical protein B0T26DRAFT_339546 [Lasiosphaeria miniovina]